MSESSRGTRHPAKRATRQGGRRSQADRGPLDETTLRERVAALERELAAERTRTAESQKPADGHGRDPESDQPSTDRRTARVRDDCGERATAFRRSL
jgi:hypothetical protein